MDKKSDSALQKLVKCVENEVLRSYIEEYIGQKELEY